MKTKPTPNQIAAIFGCAPDQVRNLLAQNAKQLSGMAQTTRKTGRKVNGYTAERLEALAEQQKEASK